MSFRRTLLISLGALSLAAASPARAESGFVGEWKGVSDGQATFTLSIFEEDGALVGTIDVPAQGIQRVRTELIAEGDSLSGRFAVSDGSETTFAGKLAEDGSVSGTYEQGYNSGSFEMKRVEEQEQK